MLEIRDRESPNSFSMNDLFLQLQIGAQSLDDAVVVEDLIKELWKQSPKFELRGILDNALSDMLVGSLDLALIKFCELVESDPLYAQAWNEKVC